MIRLSDYLAQDRYEAMAASLKATEDVTSEMWDFLLSLEGPSVKDLAVLEGEG